MDILRLGLTGSIGMGKSAVTKMILAIDSTIPVYDADAAVHRLYLGPAVEPMRAVFPEAIVDGVVDRNVLRSIVAADASVLDTLSEIVAPVLKADREEFIASHPEAQIILFDIPLLYEMKLEGEMDKVAVVSCSADIQRERVLARPSMTPELFEKILSKQMSDSDKVARADFVINTGSTLENTASQVETMMFALKF